MADRNRVCRCCGCTDTNACITPAGTCAWVLLDVAIVDGAGGARAQPLPTGICSACAEDLDFHPLMLATVGFDEAVINPVLGSGNRFEDDFDRVFANV